MTILELLIDRSSGKYTQPMKIFVCLTAVVALALAGCNNDLTKSGSARRGAPGDELVLRAHFVGSDELLKGPEAAKLKQVWSLKSSADLKNLALDRFSRLPHLWLGKALPKGSPDQAALFRPVLEDVLARESIIDWRATPVFSLAARVPEARSQVWDKNLRQALAGWNLGTPSPLAMTGRTGWELSKAGVFSIRFTRAGDWTLLTVGQNVLATESALLAKLKLPRTGGAWLEGEANLIHFKGRIPALEAFENLPTAHFSLSNRADFVRTLVQLDFARPHNWKSEPWQIPTNMLSDRIMDFTAVRGVSGVFETLPFTRDLGWKPALSQVCGWGNRDLPFQFYYAAPAQNVTNRLPLITARLRDEVKRTYGANVQGNIAWNETRQEVVWSGLPLAVPSLLPARDAGREFLVLGLFPVIKTRQPPPKELLEQLGERSDLVLYDWESTEFRIPSWRQIYQIAEIGTHRPLTHTNLVSQRWQYEVAPLLGDSATELRASSPSQMTLVRKSSIGLTAFELVTLSRWLDSSSFPAFGVYPAPTVRGKPAR